MLKIVFDTNIYISGYLFGGKPREGLENARKRLYKLFASLEILAELEEELTDPPFHLSYRHVQKIIRNLKDFAEILKAAPQSKAVRDEKDDMLLDCALAARARFLVTGDKDLLVMKKYKHIEIVTIADFLERAPWV
jgi:uncharacterized protein